MGKQTPARLVLWVIGAVVLSALSAFLTAHFVTHRHSHLSGLDGGEPGPTSDLHAWMHDQLEISEEQWARLMPYETAFEKERARLLAAIDEGGEELAAAFGGGDRGAQAIRDALERINEARGELQSTTLDHFLVMKKHLSPDQAERLIEWTHDSIIGANQN